MTQALRIVQIGFNRAGTSSIADFLRRGGFQTVDHRFISGPLNGQNLALIIEGNITAGLKPLAGLDAWAAFTDMECVTESRVLYVQKRFREIAEAHPETKFILNVRNKNEWVQSRAKFGGYLATCAKATGLTEAEMLAQWGHEWDEHLKDVQNYFSRDRLLVLDIDAPDDVALSRFVGLKKILNLRQRNKAPRGNVSQYLTRFSQFGFVGWFPQSFKNWLKNY